MPSPPNINWLTRRRGAVVLDLQATPLTSGNYGSNPKKASGSLIFPHTRTIYPGWPANTVHKTKPGGSTIVNSLTLETTSTFKYIGLYEADNTFFLVPPFTPGTNYASSAWADGDDLTYPEATYVTNIEYKNVDDETRYEIHTYTVTVGAHGDPSETISVTYDNLSPNTTGSASLMNGAMPSGRETWSIYAQFTGTPITAQNAIDSYTPYTNADLTTTAIYPHYTFVPRMIGDAAHGLTPFMHANSSGAFVQLIYSDNEYTYPTTGDELPSGGYYTYRHAASDPGIGMNNEITCNCKFYYNPEAGCYDCWYAGRTVVLEIKYKMAEVTYDVGTVIANTTADPSPPLAFKVPYIGTWSEHSTVTKTVTLPTGFTRQQLGEAFDVPLVPGYVVAIDDIKLVSVSA